MDRPFHPPGSEIMAQAFDAYAAWESRWEEDLEDIDDPLTRSTVYTYMMDGIDIDLAKAEALRQGERDEC